MSGPLPFPALTCRKCGTSNPMIYFAPVIIDNAGTCVCFACAAARRWTDQDGNLRPGIIL